MRLFLATYQTKNNTVEMFTQFSRYSIHTLQKFPKISVVWEWQNSHNLQTTALKMCRKTDHLIVRQNCRKFMFSDLIVKTLITPCHVRGSCLPWNDVWCRFYSSTKDDEMLKMWLNEIKDDFDKEYKVGGKDESVKDENSGKASSICDKYSSDEENASEIDAEKLHTSLENDFDELEKLGFTTEEIIDVMKSVQSLEENEEGHDHSESKNTDDVELSNEALNSDNSKVNAEKQNDHSKAVTNKIEQDEWAVVKMKPDVKTEWSVVEIEDFVNIAEADVEEIWESPVDLERGKMGVYDIHELLEVLQVANAQNVITICVPPVLNFADYLVIASAKSPRHMQAVTSAVKWIHKRKKSKSDKYMRIEGEKSEWCAVDLGNIVLHIFMPAIRELYDLETLWTVGAKFDPQCAEPTKDPYVFTVDDLPWLKELERASNDLEGQEQTSDDLIQTRKPN